MVEEHLASVLRLLCHEATGLDGFCLLYGVCSSNFILHVFQLCAHFRHSSDKMQLCWILTCVFFKMKLELFCHFLKKNLSR